MEREETYLVLPATCVSRRGSRRKKKSFFCQPQLHFVDELRLFCFFEPCCFASDATDILSSSTTESDGRDPMAYTWSMAACQYFRVEEEVRSAHKGSVPVSRKGLYVYSPSILQRNNLHCSPGRQKLVSAPSVDEGGGKITKGHQPSKGLNTAQSGETCKRKAADGLQSSVHELNHLWEKPACPHASTCLYRHTSQDRTGSLGSC